jgi:CubicO group peptidase (beta-lactamase class C family)
MKKILIYICFGVTLYFFQSCSTPFAPDEEEFADLEGEIGNEVSANNIPSLAAFVVKDDSIVWQQYYGYADVASRRDANKYTIYGLASVSKLIVVTAVMQLKERGLINLDTDISDYLPFSVRNPNYPDDKLTVFNLLTHTSGLNWPENDSEVPGYYRHYPFDNSPPLREWIPEFILPDGANYVSAVWMNHRPGEREWYSNIGACLLAYLVEVVSGMDYNEYCKQNIFEPLEMFNTSHAYADLDINNLATLYYQPTQQIEFFRYQGYPAGDLKSTIEDFSHFLIAYMNGGQYKNNRILAENTVNEILKIRNPASGLCLIWNCTLGNWYGHAGGKTGTSAYVEYQRDSNVALMIVTNYRHPTVYPGSKTHALVRRIAGRYSR